MSFFSLCCSISVKNVTEPIDISNAALLERLRSNTISKIELEVSKTLDDVKDAIEAIDAKETHLIKDVQEIVEETIAEAAAAADAIAEAAATPAE